MQLKTVLFGLASKGLMFKTNCSKLFNNLETFVPTNVKMILSQKLYEKLIYVVIRKLSHNKNPQKKSYMAEKVCKHIEGASNERWKLG